MTTTGRTDAGLCQAAEAMARRFLPDARDLMIEPLGHGLINETWLVKCVADRFVLQKVNRNVFADANAITANLLRVQDWLAEHQEFNVRFPRLLRDATGQATVRDSDDHAWRLMEYIDHSRVVKPLKNLSQASAVGRTLGRFHAALAGLDPAAMTLTLPDLHDTPRYRRQLDAALRKPVRPITAEVTRALAPIDARADLVPTLQRAIQDGTLSQQVTHGDPKLDNVLFDLDSDRALCLVDLDTVQPGLLHHDIADCLRSCCNRSAAEEPEPTARFDLEVGCAILGGYAEVAAHLFDHDAVSLLYPAIRLIPLELAMRFLTDHLQGDSYFRVTHPRQNLAKAQIQLALVKDIEAKRTKIEAVIGNCFSGSKTPLAKGTTPSASAASLDRKSAQIACAQRALAQLAELLEGLHHPRAPEVRGLMEDLPDDPANTWRTLNGNDWWAGAGSLAAETMADNPGMQPEQWQAEIRHFRELLIELGEILQAQGETNPGLGSWLLAFRNWNSSGV